MLKSFTIYIILFIATPAFAWQGTVVKVSDGDTIWVETATEATKIRLYGIDAPESKQPYGAEATAFLGDLALGRKVSVIDIDTDRYGRSVSIVVLDGMSLQELMLSAGYAWVYTSYCKSCTVWRDMEQKAKESGHGLWREDAVEPWVWRKR